MPPPMMMSTEFADRLSEGESDDLMKLIEAVSGKYGVTRFGYLANLRQPNAPFEAEPVIETNFPKVWQERYIERRYDKVDPLVQMGMRGFLPIDWSDVQRNDRKTRQFFGEAQDCGLFRNGIGIPIRDQKNRTAVFSVNTEMGHSEWKLFIRSHISDITYMGFLFHSAFAAQHEKTCQRREALSEREKLSLKWAAHGKTSWETAQILGLSVRTIDFHIKNSMRKLLAANKTQAVAIAVSENIIEV
jgi:DNA-binding CsgD family transcriptional regulator